MDWNLLWKAVLVVIGGTLLLRLAGRKSISQMTLAQTVIMIGLGSLLVQPIVGHDIWATFAVGFMLILTLIVIEYIEVKADKVEGFVTGRAKLIIRDGVLQEKKLRKLRFTVDQLEMKLRQQNIASINDVKWATLEPNGQVGCELNESAKPATKQDIHALRKDIESLHKLFTDTSLANTSLQKSSMQESLFTEVADKGHLENIPERLE
ncbi:Protein of uncharacterised function (DUF421) [Lysinibacillus sphaericus]|nr:Protein of uncharacterised function (DUF421) [Lysinibacillus sphaericus]